MRAISTSSQGPGRGANRAGEEGLDLGLNDALLQHCGGGAPQRTVEALMFSLRSRGTKALEEAATKRRISELAEQQLHEVCGRLQRLKPDIAPAWPPEQITILVDAWNSCHG